MVVLTLKVTDGQYSKRKDSKKKHLPVVGSFSGPACPEVWTNLSPEIPQPLIK